MTTTGNNFDKPSSELQRSPHTPKVRTTEWKRGDDGTPFLADVYMPRARGTPGRRPIALLIHGGGHVMLSRSDVLSRQVQTLLDYGFLPISIDCRLCPEINIRDGAIADVADAPAWVRSSGTEWARLELGRGNIPDPRRVVFVGWSIGGTPALQAKWMAAQRGINPPSVILAFYCPTDYQDECKCPLPVKESCKWSKTLETVEYALKVWTKPNVPEGSDEFCIHPSDIVAGVQEKPVSISKEFWPVSIAPYTTNSQ